MVTPDTRGYGGKAMMLTKSSALRGRAAAFVLAASIVAPAAAMEPPSSPPPAPQAATRDDLLRALVEHSRFLASLDGGRLAGPGAEHVQRLATASQFVLMGESHGNEGVADFATALWRLLHPLGFGHAAVETDPWVAERLSQQLREGGLEAWADYAVARGGAPAAPFFTWTAEARFALAVIDNTRDSTQPALWGLDQVFMGSAAWLLQELAMAAHSSQARAIAAELAKSMSAGGLSGLMLIGPERLAELRSALSTPADQGWRDFADALLLSQEIYRPFTGGPGEVTLANDQRERLMRRQFVDYYGRAERDGGKSPRVLLKFGANHLYRGASPVQVQALGGFVSELAAAGGGESLALLVLCGPGGKAGDLSGRSSDCGEELANGDWSFLLPYLDAKSPTLFDLRTWRLRPGRIGHLPVEVQRAVGSFDLLVFVPGGAAAAFLPGISPLQMP
jgi:hypothetical protein